MESSNWLFAEPKSAAWALGPCVTSVDVVVARAGGSCYVVHVPFQQLRIRLKTNRPQPWLAFGLIAAALVVWAGLFALGAYLEWGADRPRHDLRKPLIILACMAGFLTFWGAALWLRAGRGKR